MTNPKEKGIAANDAPRENNIIHYNATAEIVNILTARGFPDLPTLGIFHLSASEVAALFSANFPGYIIPYKDIYKQPVIERNRQPFMRVRLENYTGKGKYRAEKGSGNHAYLADLPAVDWVAIANDTAQPLAFTEGEFKGVGGCLMSGAIPTIAFPGVSSFLNDGKLAPELSPFKLTGRPAYIVYDAPLNDDVTRACFSLAASLAQKGANVQICDISQTETYRTKFQPAEKCGLDDYWLAGGTWKELLAAPKLDTDALGPKAAVGPWLSKIAYYKGGGGDEYIHLSNYIGQGNRIRKGPAMRADLANQLILDVNKKPKSPLDLVMASKYRIEVDKIICAPHLPMGLVEGGSYNEWQGFAVEPIRDDIKMTAIKQFVRSFFSSCDSTGKVTQTEEQAMVEAWYWGFHAHIARCTGIRPTASPIFASAEEGIGKSFALEMHSKWMGQRACKILTPDELFHQFNDWAAGAYYVICNEPSSDANKHKQVMKTLRTNDTLSVNPKFGVKYSIPNHLAIGATTNESYAWGMSEDSRRDLVYAPIWKSQLAIQRMPSGPVRDAHQTHYDLTKTLAEKFAHDGKSWGAALLWGLLADTTSFSPTAAAPNTLAKAAMAIHAKSTRVDEKERIIDEARKLIAKNGGIFFSPTMLASWLCSLDISLAKNEVRKHLKGVFMGEGFLVKEHQSVAIGGRENVTSGLSIGHCSVADLDIKTRVKWGEVL